MDSKNSPTTLLLADKNYPEFIRLPEKIQHDPLFFWNSKSFRLTHLFYIIAHYANPPPWRMYGGLFRPAVSSFCKSPSAYERQDSYNTNTGWQGAWWGSGLGLSRICKIGLSIGADSTINSYGGSNRPPPRLF